jgi:hypothetical protein
MLEDLFVGADSPIKGQVDTFADLPATAELGDLFVVKTTTGVIGVNRKIKGLYRWDGAAWVFADGIEANKVIYNNADSSLTSGTVKAAIDELDTKRQDASNLTSGTIAEARLPAIDADNTTITNLEVDNLKTGVLDTDLTTVSANDDTLASAKAIKAYVDANAGGVDPRDSFTQNAGQYIGTEGIRARDVGGIAMMNNAGTAGVTVADNGDADITTKMTASEIKARNVNGLKLHDDGGTGLLVKDGGDVEVDTKVSTTTIQAKDASGLQLLNDGGDGMFVDDGGNARVSGKLGIGKVATDTTILDMERSETDGGGLSIRLNNTNTTSGSSHASLVLLGNNGAVQAQYYADGFGGTAYLRTYTNHPISIGTNASERMRIEAGGNVKIINQLGIGKDPSQYAVLDMEMAVTSGAGAGINLKNTASGTSYAVLNLNGNNGGVTGQYYAGGGTAVLRTYTNHGLVFGTNATERARITNGGNFGIGTSNPSQKLHVVGNAIVSGSLSKGSGSFDIEHPDPAKKDTHRLRHYFVETPSAGGNIYKYQLDCNEGENYIDLPDYFQHLNTDSLVWANAFKHFGRAWGEVIEGGKRAKIVCEQSGTYNILIFGDRKDKLAVDEFTKYGVEYKVDSTKEQTIDDN